VCGISGGCLPSSSRAVRRCGGFRGRGSGRGESPLSSPLPKLHRGIVSGVSGRRRRAIAWDFVLPPDHMWKQVGERVMVPGERAHVDSVAPDGRAWGAGCFRFPMDRCAFPDRELRPLPQSIASGKGMATGGAVCGLNVGEFRCQNSTRGKSSGSWPDTRCFPRREGALRRTGPASASDSPPTSAAPQSD